MQWTEGRPALASGPDADNPAAVDVDPCPDLRRSFGSLEVSWGTGGPLAGPRGTCGPLEAPRCAGKDPADRLDSGPPPTELKVSQNQ